MNRLFLLFIVICSWAICGGMPSGLSAQDRHYVELNILADAGTMIGSGQKWLEKLSEVGADSVRMGRSNQASKVGVNKSQSGSGRASYTITGVINSRDELVLPGGRYSLRDTDKIRAYIESIRADGAEVALAEKMAYGLTAQQLVDLHATLSPAYETATSGLLPSQVLEQVRRQCPTPITIDASAQSALGGDYTLSDEMQGLSQGTVLAAALRPLGLVMAPRREPGKATEIVITDSRRVDEHWPIGWPLQSRPSESAPQLYQRIPVNIRNYTLGATLKAIQRAVDVPFLFDHNSMARNGVDLEEIRVNLQAEKLAYQLVLNRIVAQARPRMQLDVRADETGKVFLWFSSR